MFDYKIAVVIPMAGCSERFPSSCPKQYFKILGKPLFMFCVEEFFKLTYITNICLVVDKVEMVQSLINEHFNNSERIIFALGGNSRHASIKNGLIELSKCKSTFKVIVIHDGARPIVPESLLLQIINEAALFGASGSTRPLVSTIIKPLSNSCLETSLDRNKFLFSETPQAFLYNVIMDAYEKCSEDDMERGTECLQLTLKYCGVRAKLIPGPDSLWKVTDKRDLYSVESYIKELSTDVCLLREEENEVIRIIKKFLEARVRRVDCYFSDNNVIAFEHLYNVIIYFHNEEIEEEKWLHLKSLLDINRQGIIIHVVEHASLSTLSAIPMGELYESGNNRRNQYESLQKGVVVIHYFISKQEKRLVDLIASLIFIDNQSISGQTLFL